MECKVLAFEVKEKVIFAHYCSIKASFIGEKIFLKIDVNFFVKSFSNQKNSYIEKKYMELFSNFSIILQNHFQNEK